MTEVRLEPRSSHAWSCNSVSTLSYLGPGFLSHLSSPGRCSQNSDLAMPQVPIWFICELSWVEPPSNLALKSCVLKRYNELTKITEFVHGRTMSAVDSSWTAAQRQAVAAMKSRLQIWLQILALPLSLWSWSHLVNLLDLPFPCLLNGNNQCKGFLMSIKWQNSSGCSVHVICCSPMPHPLLLHGWLPRSRECARGLTIIVPVKNKVLYFNASQT